MQHYSYICDNIVSPTSDISILTTKPIDDSNRLNFQAGQYVDAILENGIHLPLSIANAPQENGELVFHIRHNARHQLAAKWLTEIEKSSKIILAGPNGRCTLDRIAPDSNLIFLAGGTGYAPIRSLLLALFEKTRELPPIYFYWGVTHPEDAYDLTALKEWAHKFPSLQVKIVLSDLTHYPQWEGAKGWVHEYCANKHASFEKFTVFASGPFEMIQAAYQRFTANGLNSSQFISDMLDI